MEEYALNIELQAWYIKWKYHPETKEVNTLSKALAALDKLTFPSLITLLRIDAMLRFLKTN